MALLAECEHVVGASAINMPRLKACEHVVGAGAINMPRLKACAAPRQGCNVYSREWLKYFALL